MQGDFTRSTFKPESHYNGVRLQQGRVLLDAEFNEQADIAAHLRQTATRDIIGPCGAPQDNAGFAIDVTSDGLDLMISPGRLYVDGILCQVEDLPVAITYSNQPDYPSPEPALSGDSPPAAGTYLAYVDVWQRHITALEDATIREVALGGPDTTTRTKTVWQVKLFRAGEVDDTSLNCSSELEDWQTITAPSTGLLSARAEPAEVATEPCEVPALAGYRGLENQLYRVEVHRVISDTEITIKWSRENGSVVFAWISQDTLDPHKLTLSSTGRDEVLGLATDNWVELTDDRRELHSAPGPLVRVVDVKDNVLTIDPGAESIHLADFPLHPRVRRWDMPRDVGEIAIDLTSADHWVELENGLQVTFAPGTYRPGDYWYIAARTATRDIEWPRDESNGEPLAQAPHGIYHHYCRMAVLRFDGTTWTRLSDCRQFFPPLTEMLRFFYVSGDGQETLPGAPLYRPLQVGVANAQWPIAGALVKFQVVDGDGQLQAAGESPCADFTSGGTTVVEVETGADGVAACCWRLEGTLRSQQVEVTLQKIDGKPMLDDTGNPLMTPIRFNANLSIASQVAYNPEKCPNLSGVTTVQEAIDVLCQMQHQGGCCVTVGQGGEYPLLDKAITALLAQGQRDICICLLPGDHAFPGLDLVSPVEAPELHIKIVGCGPGSRVFLEKTMRFTGVRAVTLDAAVFELRFPVEGQGDQVTLDFDRCAEVSMTSCHLTGFTLAGADQPPGVLLSITNAGRVLLKDNVFEAALGGSFVPTRSIFEETGAAFLVELFSLPRQPPQPPQPPQDIFASHDFRQQALESAKQLVAFTTAERQQLRRALEDSLSKPEFSSILSPGEILSLQKLMADLGLVAAGPIVEDFYDTLLAIRLAAIKSRPGVAVILGAEPSLEVPQDGALPASYADDHATLENNDILGILSLYGLPPTVDFVRQSFNPNILGLIEARLRGGTLALRGRGVLDTLQLRGNRLVRLAVASHIFNDLLSILEEGENNQLFGLFNRCLMSDNVVEGDDNWLVCVHLSMHGSDFTMRAAHLQHDIGLIIADSSIYVANHSDPGQVLRDISRNSARMANLDIAIV